MGPHPKLRMTVPAEARDLVSVIAEVLTSAHLSHGIIVATGRLLIADAQLNLWFASQKHPRDEAMLPLRAPLAESPRLSEERYAWTRGLTPVEREWLLILDEWASIVNDVAAAWESFRVAEWPREDVEQWTDNRTKFERVLNACVERLSQMGAALGRAPGERRS